MNATAAPTSNVPANQPTIMESVIIKGDLSRLTGDERAQYYIAVCKSCGLNPLTRPFEFIVLNGRLVLYAKREATDQLRQIHGISITIVSKQHEDGIYTVHARAKDNAGREDEDFGAVALSEQVKGEARANQIMKAVTKAKRRVTLSISGLGFMDETELEDVDQRRPSPTITDETGELISAEQAGQIRQLMSQYTPQGVQMFLNKYGVGSVDDLPKGQFADAVDALAARNKAMAERAAEKESRPDDDRTRE